jgi:predicted alpha/beta-fold hydrolase
VQAQDDPMIPFGIFEGPEVGSNPNLSLLAPEHGGHLGFLSRKRPRFWADEVVGEWILNRMQEAEGEQSGPVSRLEDR